MNVAGGMCHFYIPHNKEYKKKKKKTNIPCGCMQGLHGCMTSILQIYIGGPYPVSYGYI